jgi:fatty acid desaturase
MQLPNLCPYKNALGIPGKGVHSYRIFNIAIMDVIMTIIGALVISYLSGWNFGWTLLGLFLLGIFLHRLFCVRTTIDKILFPNSN